MNQVSIKAGVLDLYSPKFGLDTFGKAGERIILNVVISKNSGPIRLFGTYRIESRHAQISSDFLGTLGGAAEILSVSCYTLQDAISEINTLCQSQIPSWGFGLMQDGHSLFAKLESRRFPATALRNYTVGGRFYLTIRLLGKKVKIELSDRRIKVYDFSRREISGLAVIGNRLVPKRAFQHPELDMQS